MPVAKKASIGDKFGRWTIIENPFMENNRTMVICKCECGTIRKRSLSEFNGKAKSSLSCGCIAKELRTTHGKTNTKLYSIFACIIARCENINDTGYDNYGDRGITICDEWRNDFQCFYDWAMVNGYQDHLEIDRKDNDLGYSPENCRWVTRIQNQWNKGPEKNSTSKYKGVHWDKRRNKWMTQIRKDGKVYSLGRFENEGDAARVYNEKAKELFGEYAWLNKITP